MPRVIRNIYTKFHQPTTMETSKKIGETQKKFMLWGDGEIFFLKFFGINQNVKMLWPLGTCIPNFIGLRSWKHWKKSGKTCREKQQNGCQTQNTRFSKSHHFLTKWNLYMRSSRDFFVRVLRRPLKQFEIGTLLGKSRKIVEYRHGCCGYIAHLASRLPKLGMGGTRFHGCWIYTYHEKQDSGIGYSLGPHSGRLVLLCSITKIMIVNFHL